MAALEQIRNERGMLSRIARGLGITRGAVAQWERVPAERAPQVSRITGIPLHELRPDLFEAPKPSAEAA